MTVWRRATRALMLLLACTVLGVSAVPARAAAQVDGAAQVELVARKAKDPVRQARSAQAPSRSLRTPRTLLPAARALQRRHLVPSRPPAILGRLYLQHRALLR